MGLLLGHHARVPTWLGWDLLKVVHHPLPILGVRKQQCLVVPGASPSFACSVVVEDVMTQVFVVEPFQLAQDEGLQNVEQG